MKKKQGFLLSRLPGSFFTIPFSAGQVKKLQGRSSDSFLFRRLPNFLKVSGKEYRNNIIRLRIWNLQQRELLSIFTTFPFNSYSRPEGVIQKPLRWQKYIILLLLPNNFAIIFVLWLKLLIALWFVLVRSESTKRSWLLRSQPLKTQFSQRFCGAFLKATVWARGSAWGKFRTRVGANPQLKIFY